MLNTATEPVSHPLAKTPDRPTLTRVRKQQACNITASVLDLKLQQQSDVAHLPSSWRPSASTTEQYFKEVGGVWWGRGQPHTYLPFSTQVWRRQHCVSHWEYITSMNQDTAAGYLHQTGIYTLILTEILQLYSESASHPLHYKQGLFSSQ